MSQSTTEQLATLYGLTTTYTDAANQVRTCSEEAILTVLRILGAKITTNRDVKDGIAARLEELWRTGLADVTTIWTHEVGGCLFQGPVATFTGTLAGRILLENGDAIPFTVPTSECQTLDTFGRGQSKTLRVRIPLPQNVPVGYHTLEVAVGDRSYRSFLLSAPATAISPQMRWPHGPPLGAFLPLYSLYSSRGLGTGTLSDLESLVRWSGNLGLGFFATLPLLSTFLTEPFEPSPYAPATRLFWNELFADVRHGGIQDAPVGLTADIVRQAVVTAHDAPFVDYRQQHGLQFSALRALASEFFSGEGPKTPEFAAFLAEYPEVFDYAAFRAYTDTTQRPWSMWSNEAKAGTINPADVPTDLQSAYVMGQWLCHQQLERVGAVRDTGLYLDLPVGVHPDSYDIWKHRNLFAVGAAAGAPPDPLFSKGQNWGFPPMHPTHLRDDNYRYFRAMVRRPMKYAAMVRLDHVMSLHRMYWVPDQFKATDGVYVHYPEQELAAILCIESSRTGCVVAGEDLGTVPPIIREIMDQRGILRLYVGQFSISPNPDVGLVPPKNQTIACLNTHDMPTFASFWRETDLDDQVALGLLDEDDEHMERARRKSIRRSVLLHLQQLEILPNDPTLEDVLAGLLTLLAKSDATCTVVNLEDLWLEMIPQNTPGTWKERPNWRRRARYPLEKIIGNTDVANVLRHLARTRPTKWHGNLT